MSHQSSRFDINDVLDCMRTDVPAASADAKRRVSMRLADSLTALAAQGESAESDDAMVADDDASPSSSIDLSQSSNSSSLVSAAQPAGKAAQWLGAIMARPVTWSLAMFSVGAACGAGIHAAISAPATIVTMTSRTPAPLETPRPAGRGASGDDRGPSATRDEPGAVGGTEAALPESPLLSSAAAPSGRARTSGHAAGLAAQQALLDEARKALAQGDDSAALRAIELHTRRYPESVMIEEREALAIKALVGKGRNAEARSRGERFRARFPRSLLMSSIDETLGTIP
jgi:hypothetical protein